jgi:hypothetical protein
MKSCVVGFHQPRVLDERDRHGVLTVVCSFLESATSTGASSLSKTSARPVSKDCIAKRLRSAVRRCSTNPSLSARCSTTRARTLARLSQARRGSPSLSWAERHHARSNVPQHAAVRVALMRRRPCDRLLLSSDAPQAIPRSWITGVRGLAGSGRLLGCDLGLDGDRRCRTPRVVPLRSWHHCDEVVGAGTWEEVEHVVPGVALGSVKERERSRRRVRK